MTTDKLIERIAKRLGSRSPYVSWEDLAQEMHLWVLEHPDWVEKYTENPDDRRLGRALRSCAEQALARDKAERSGYKLFDQYHYSTRQLAGQLPDVLLILEDDEPYWGDGTTCMDITGAYDKLSADDQQILYEYYMQDNHEALAASYDLTEDALRARAHRAIVRLQRALGGAAPTAHMREMAA